MERKEICDISSVQDLERCIWSPGQRPRPLSKVDNKNRVEAWFNPSLNSGDFIESDHFIMTDVITKAVEKYISVDSFPVELSVLNTVISLASECTEVQYNTILNIVYDGILSDDSPITASPEFLSKVNNYIKSFIGAVRSSLQNDVIAIDPKNLIVVPGTDGPKAEAVSLLRRHQISYRLKRHRKVFIPANKFIILNNENQVMNIDEILKF